MKNPIAAYSRFSVSAIGQISWGGIRRDTSSATTPPNMSVTPADSASAALAASFIIGSTAAKARARSGSMQSSAPAWTRLSRVRLLICRGLRRRARQARSLKKNTITTRLIIDSTREAPRSMQSSPRPDRLSRVRLLIIRGFSRRARQARSLNGRSPRASTSARTASRPTPLMAASA